MAMMAAISLPLFVFISVPNIGASAPLVSAFHPVLLRFPDETSVFPLESGAPASDGDVTHVQSFPTGHAGIPIRIRNVVSVSDIRGYE